MTTGGDLYDRTSALKKSPSGMIRQQSANCIGNNEWDISLGRFGREPSPPPLSYRYGGIIFLKFNNIDVDEPSPQHIH